MSDLKAVIGEDESVWRIPYFVPRPKPSPIPTAGIFDEPTRCLRINVEWTKHFRGIFDALDQPDTWIPDETHDVEWARQQVREAILAFALECVMCCEEQTLLLEQLVSLNTSIVNNQLTMIENNTTIIDQNQTAEYNNYVNQYQQFVTNNQNTTVLNQMLYDGTPQSIFPDAGANFNSTGDDRLCSAIETYINAQIYTHIQQAQVLQFVGNVTAGAVAALAALFGLISGGASIAIGVAINTAIFAAFNIWEAILNDTDAQRKVRCCMYDALKDQPLTRSVFQTSVDNCGFEAGTNEATLAQQIASDNFNYLENWTAFLRAMNQAGGNASDACNCECTTDDIVLVSENDCILTKIDATHWRVQQSNFTIPNPNNPENRDYTMKFREEFYRCFDVVGVNFSMRYYYQTTCDGTEIEGIGGGGGQMIRATWINGQNQDYQPIDGIIEIACPPEE